MNRRSMLHVIGEAKWRNYSLTPKTGYFSLLKDHMPCAQIIVSVQWLTFARKFDRAVNEVWFFRFISVKIYEGFCQNSWFKLIMNSLHSLNEKLAKTLWTLWTKTLRSVYSFSPPIVDRNKDKFYLIKVNVVSQKYHFAKQNYCNIEYWKQPIDK